MNTPVKFTIANLLKDKGFKQKECPSYLLVDFSQTNTFKTNPENIGIGDLIGYYVPNKTVNAPTITEVVMWIYEKLGIWITVDWMTRIKPYNSGFISHLRGARKRLNYDNYTVINNTKHPGYEVFDSPAEAYEAAIEYCLTMFI